MSLTSLAVGGSKVDPSLAIAEIRTIYKDVESLRAAETLSKETAPISDFEDATLYADSNNKTRLYVESLGGQDSVVTVSCYYDTAEKLRFIFCRAGAVNGSVLERRYYFSSEGTLIDQKQKRVEGDGYTWDWERIEKDTVRGRARSPRESFKRFEAAARAREKETVAP